MSSLEASPEDALRPVADADVDVEVLLIGAGIIGLGALYRIREEGYSVRTLEAAGGIGGTWYWNRYPEARFDSESYSYAYLFSNELFHDWFWSEHFAGQPEIERYLNHVVDRFDLRRHVTLNARVTSMLYDDASGTWVVKTEDGTELRSHFVVSTTGVLSIPYWPDVPGRENFRGEAYHTGLWPQTPVDFVDKRVAVIGTGASGIQMVPAIVDQVASMTVYQRTPNWCVPLNNRPITDEEQAEMRANFESIRETLLSSPAGFLHRPHDRKTFEDSEEERHAFYEKMWRAPGFSTLGSNYIDLMTDREANAQFCKFMADKIRSIVKDPETAEKLIPKDHAYGGKRPPFGTDYYEAYNNPNVSLVDLRETPMVRVTETGIETTDGLQEFDIIVWATGFDFGTGAMLRMGIEGFGGKKLSDHWSDGPRTFLGLQTEGFPNLFFPGGPHGAGGNNPRYGADQVEYVIKAMNLMRERGYRVIDVPPQYEETWTSTLDAVAAASLMVDHSYFLGANIPGKPRRILYNLAGKPKMMEFMDEVLSSDFAGFMH